MMNAKPVLNPIAHHFKLSVEKIPKSESDKAYMERVPYASAVGSLMYAMVYTRPDLAYVVSIVSRFISNPRKEHWLALKWILRYIKGTLRKGLRYGGKEDGSNDSKTVVGFVDSNYAGCLDTKKSLTGYVLLYMGQQ